MTADPVTTVELRPLLHPLFSAVPSPPSHVWIEGRESAFGLLDRLPRDGLAVVGTRAPDRRALFHLVETIRRLRGTPLVILSGLARGIDAAAHEAALSAGLPTIAILGCGIRQTYPPENARLRARILDAGGLVLSEFPPDEGPLPSYFISRNRLIAGFSAATWIVQSGYRSGALNTAKWARRQGRGLFVTPSFPGDPGFLGNENLLANEVEAIPLWNAEGFVKQWIGLFSTIERNRRRRTSDAALEIVLEVERGMREGKSLYSILEERALRTGESIDELLERVQRTF
ncbi:MAG: DNA-processing protein DprA [Bdellovibrionales bacterium]|nr:DNA-processing protein DprA [Bdellovibrionales bacterium]